MTYEGYREDDGAIRAVRLEFTRNEMSKGEANLWKTLAPKFKAPDPQKGKPGEIRIEEVGKFKLVPNQEAQEYVQRVGERLIPAY